MYEGTPILLTPQKRLSLFSTGQNEFNEGLYFEAHEAWEELWKYERGIDKDFIQGLIMVAGHFVQIQKKIWSGAESLAESAKQKLKIPPSNTLYKKIDIEPLIAALNYNLSILRSESLTQRYYNSTIDEFLFPKIFEI